jgi:5-formyltetrahydrofolate cyclo-ligase
MTTGRPDSPSSDKSEFRKAAAQRRREIVPVTGEAFIPSFAAIPLAPSSVVAGYWPLGDEADVRPLLAELSARGHVIVLPAVLQKNAPLVFRRWFVGQELERGPHRTVHPPASAEVVEPDLLLVPLLAFDDRGGRLGYGGGYYDRTLAALRGAGKKILAVGVAYGAQRWPALPMDEHDQRLDWVITEQGALEMCS